MGGSAWYQSAAPLRPVWGVVRWSVRAAFGLLHAAVKAPVPLLTDRQLV
jgi:hypothetical protein